MSRSLSSSSSPINDVRVVSYNVLSTSLAQPDYYTKCEPQYLESNYRLKKLKEKLDIETSKNSIICLQEISNQCAGTLHSYFSKKGYYLSTALYGHKFNGYMGVGIAIPLEKYSIETLDITRIADTKKFKKTFINSNFIVAFLKSYIYQPIMSMLKSIGLIKPEFRPFDDAGRRMNQMLSIRLTPLKRNPDIIENEKINEVENKDTKKSNSFVIGTYHMPCMFQFPQVMMIHCALSAQHIHKFARGDPYIFAGDFNIKPVDSMYKLLTEGDVPLNDPARPINEPLGNGEVDDWKVCVQPLKSAYKEFLGSEPEYTNFAQVKNQEPFVDTLDYIFLSEQWRVKDVLKIGSKQESTGPFPTKNEPSDHLLIAADLAIE